MNDADAMNDATPGRRAFLTRVSRALLGAGALAITGPDRVPGGEGDAAVVTGRETFDRLVTQAREHRWAERLIGERTGAIGMALRHTPYVDGTLELYEDREICSINLRGLDCVTFFESALAFARMLGRGGRTPEALLAEVTFTRYRRGQLTDYASPLHYMSDSIVGITTTIDGLDCAHAGLCYREGDGALRLLHASTTRKAVTLDEDLATYLAGVSTHTGIIVARPLEATQRSSAVR